MERHTIDDDPGEFEPVPETREPADPDYPILDDDEVEEDADTQ